MRLLQELLDLLQVTGFRCAFRLNQDLPNGLFFFHGYRLGDGAEGVKINFVFSFKSGEKRPVSLGKMREKFLRRERLAKSKIEFLRVENRFLAEFLADP